MAAEQENPRLVTSHAHNYINCEIILSTPEITLTLTEQTAQLKGEKRPRRRSQEVRKCGFEGKQMTGAVEGKEVWLQRRERERAASPQGNAQGECFLKAGGVENEEV